MSVEFSGNIRQELSPALRALLRRDLESVFTDMDPRRARARPTPGRECSDDAKPATPESSAASGDSGALATLGNPKDTGPQILVLGIFSGHTPEYDVKTILGVEVTWPDCGYESHIIKIGRRDKVEPDFKGWDTCTRGQMVASRIFAPVRLFELGGDRVAVLYRDGFTLFGPNARESRESQPEILEIAVQWAVMDDKPDPASVERALAHIFTDLGIWFYRGAKTNNALARDFYAGHMRLGADAEPGEGVLAAWGDNAERRTLRRHAVWVLAGRDIPDADPETAPARYLDPVDYVRWAFADPARLPPTLVGRSHGDLHARNVLVGIRRREVQYPAVYDYGDMGDENVLAWDFAKLETELKARLLPRIVQTDPAALAHLVKRSELRREKPVSAGPISENAARADRLAAFLAFEELLDEATRTIRDKLNAEAIAPAPLNATGVPKLDRLLSILLSIRREAALYLGYGVSKRSALWKDELYFALAVYGLVNVRWDYSSTEQEAALVGAGAALARMPSMPGCLRDAISAVPDPTADHPSYRVPLANVYAWWKEKQYAKGCDFAERAVLEVRRNSAGKAVRFDARKGMEHAVPLIGQALLMQTEMGQLHAVESALESLRAQAREFDDYETLGRIGRMFKDAGDRKWESEAASGPLTEAMRPPSLLMFDKAFAAYAEGYEATGDVYVGINAATMALLTGLGEKAKSYARDIAKACGSHRNEKKDRYWLFATQGEAALILGGNAEHFYREALAELTPGQWGMADSSYKQACRLWKVLGDDRVVPVLRLFESSDAGEYLTRRFLGRDFDGPADRAG